MADCTLQRLAAAAAAGGLVAALLVLARRPRQPVAPAAASSEAPEKVLLAALAKEIWSAGIGSLADAQQLARTPRWRSLIEAAAKEAQADGRKLCLAIYPGSFNPPSLVHVEIARLISSSPDISADALWLDMTAHRAKKLYINKVKVHRRQMSEAAVEHLPKVGVAELMAQLGDHGWGREYFDALRVLLGDTEGQRTVRLVWVMGSDVVEGMCWWSDKAAELLRCCDQVVVLQRQRDEDSDVQALSDILGVATDTGNPRVTTLKFADQKLEHVSSSAIRRYLVTLLHHVPLTVLRYIVNHQHLVDFYVSLYREVDVEASMSKASAVLREEIKSSQELSTPHDTPTTRPHLASLDSIPSVSLGGTTE